MRPVRAKSSRAGGSTGLLNRLGSLGVWPASGQLERLAFQEQGPTASGGTGLVLSWGFQPGC